MKKLTKEQILVMHRELIEAYGGSDGIRDEDLLESALAAPFQTFDGNPLWPTVQQKVVRLGFGLIMNHPFVDGNKRTGAHIMLTACRHCAVNDQVSHLQGYDISVGNLRAPFSARYSTLLLE